MDVGASSRTHLVDSIASIAKALDHCTLALVTRPRCGLHGLKRSYGDMLHTWHFLHLEDTFAPLLLANEASTVEFSLLNTLHLLVTQVVYTNSTYKTVTH